MSSVQWKKTLSQTVKKYAALQPEKIVAVANDKPVTYAQLDKLVSACRASLIELGAKKGDYIVLSAVMKAEYIAAFLAVKSLRLVAVPINKTAPENEAAEIVNRVHAKVFLTDNPRYQNIPGTASLVKSCQRNNNIVQEPEIEEVPEDEITEVLFTSGTTGKPKGAMLSQKGIEASIFNTAEGMDMRSDDILLLPLPLNHSFGLRVMRSALYLGATIVLQNGFTFAKETATNIEKWNCNCMAAVNAGFEILQQQMGNDYKRVFEKMRYIEFSAGAVPAAKRRELAAGLPNTRLYNTWGSTETGGGLFLEFSKEPGKMESAGKPINDIETAVIGTDGQALPNGEYGRLALKSSALLTGYFNDAELTSQTLHDGWLWTNDLAMKDADGYIYLKGRIDDIINVGGEKVAPGDVERLISELDFVKECACFGVDDPKGILGQVPAVLWTAQGNIDRAEQRIKEQVLKSGGSLMMPQILLKVEEVPRNYMGKPDRKKMDDIYKASLNNEEKAGENFVEKFMNLVLTRRSVRTFTEQPVEQGKLNNILLAGRMAPSGHNMQTWRFTVISDKTEIELVRNTTEAVAKREQTSFYGFNNPCSIIIASNDRRNDDATADTCAAIENMLLAAHVQGLGGCWINSWIKICDQPEIRKLMDKYSIPKTHIVYGIVGLGYPASPVKMPTKKDNVVKFYGKESGK